MKPDHLQATATAATYIALDEQPYHDKHTPDGPAVNLAAAYLEDHAEVERLRGDVARLAGVIGQMEREQVGMTDGAHAIRLERDAAIQRAEAAERERELGRIGRDATYREWLRSLRAGDVEIVIDAMDYALNGGALLTKGENDDG